MGQFVLGVDGGGTKTQCAVFDLEGKRLELVDWGPTNYECLKGGFEGLKLELQGMLAAALDKNGLKLHELTGAVFGLAGVDTLFQHRTISSILDSMGLKNFLLCNDAYLGIKAGSALGYGICAINGTGCTVAGLDPSGAMLQIGGYGDFSGDTGGGGYLGAKAVSMVYDQLFKYGRKTLMKDLFFELLGIDKDDGFMEAIVMNTVQGRFSARDFNMLAFKAANQGDQVALDLLEHMGRENARSINSAIRRLDFKNCGRLDIVMAGSIYSKGENPAAVERIKADVSQQNPGLEISFNILKQPPVMGAVVWALSRAGADGCACIYEKVRQQFE